MSRPDVVIVGAGPTGLMLSAELALAGVACVVVERRADQTLAGMRAGGLHARTIEVLDERGIAERFLAAGRTAQVAGFAWTPLDISDAPTRHPYGLALWQNEIERLLTDWVAELGVTVWRGRAATDVSQDAAGVEVRLCDGGALQADYLVGCDGGRSQVRKVLGVDFPGWEATCSNLLAEAQLTEEPPWGPRHDAKGIHGISRVEGRETIRILVTEQHLDTTREPTLADLSGALVAVYGRDYGVHSPVWLTRFTDAARQVASYRAGRVLLAGDAAHVHPPIGGQGLNLGVQDAVNLGWKLAQVVKGQSPDTLLDSYQAERHPVAARVLRNILAQSVLLGRLDDRKTALREALANLLAMDEPRRRFGAMSAGLDVHYDFGPGHPLLGRRMPDLDLSTAQGPRRMFTFLHAARPALVNLERPGSIDIGPWSERVQVLDAAYAGRWELPVLGPVAAPSAVLVRPDGYVAWVGQDANDSGLTEALTTWFGPQTA